MFSERPKTLLFLIALVTASALPLFVKSQTVIQGHVYEYLSRQPLDAVSVISSSGKGVVSDSNGRYSIRVDPSDSIWFSYLGKNTPKYPVDTIANVLDFDIGLHVDIPWLAAVRVRSRNYKQDSIQFRQDYAKAFNFRKPGVRASQPPPPSSYDPSVPSAAGLDLDELINMFRFRRTRNMLALQKRLLKEEQDKYVDHRFTKRLVRELTKIPEPELPQFMAVYRPPYDVLQRMNDLELGYYVEQCYRIYLNRKNRQSSLVQPSLQVPPAN